MICTCLRPLSVGVPRSLPAVETVPIFSLVTYSSERLSPFPSYLKVVLQPYVNLEAPFSLCSRKSFAFDCLLIIHNHHELAPPLPAFPVGDVSGKVWSTLITTQQAGIYPRTSLGFAIYRLSSPAPIYWRFALSMYCPCANILALRVLSVNTTCIMLVLVWFTQVKIEQECCYGQTHHEYMYVLVL